MTAPDLCDGCMAEREWCLCGVVAAMNSTPNGEPYQMEHWKGTTYLVIDGPNTIGVVRLNHVYKPGRTPVRSYEADRHIVAPNGIACLEPVTEADGQRRRLPTLRAWRNRLNWTHDRSTT